MMMGVNFEQFADPQLQSIFFSAPAEIRDAIYAHLIPERIHVYLRYQRLRFSACTAHFSNVWGHPTPRHTQRTFMYSGKCLDSADVLLYHRSQSSWGSHWRCEEVFTKKKDHLVALDMLLVCKRVFVELVERMAITAALQINELGALNALRPGVLGLDLGYSFTILEHLLPNLKELDISMRLPFDIFTWVEDAGWSSNAPRDPLISAWSGLPSALACLPKLRRLRIWLDHDKPYSWSLVNERAFLFLFEPSRENPEMEISFNLPKLNPKLESALRHFTEGISSPRGTMAIARRHRQETWGVLGEDLEFYLSWSGRRDGRTRTI